MIYVKYMSSVCTDMRVKTYQLMASGSTVDQCCEAPSPKGIVVVQQSTLTWTAQKVLCRRVKNFESWRVFDCWLIAVWLPGGYDCTKCGTGMICPALSSVVPSPICDAEMMRQSLSLYVFVTKMDRYHVVPRWTWRAEFWARTVPRSSRVSSPRWMLQLRLGKSNWIEQQIYWIEYKSL